MLNKIILNVPYKDKDLAKQLGAKWDKQQRVWYVPAGLNQEKFTAWLPNKSHKPKIIINNIGLVRNIVPCWSCKGFCTVHAIYAREIQAIDKLDNVTERKVGLFVFLEVSVMPEELAEFLLPRCLNYRLGKVNVDGFRTYRNHCDHCSMGLSDTRLHKKGSAFNPKKIAELKSLQCISLQFFDDLVIESEYLDYTDHALWIEFVKQSDYITDFV